jgi:excisionase family DNA binding protein
MQVQPVVTAQPFAPGRQAEADSGQQAVALSLLLTQGSVEHLVQLVARLVEQQLRDQPDYMNTEQVAAYLGWSRRRIDNLCSQGRIPYYKDGGLRIFIRQEIDAWVRGLNGIRLRDALVLAA